MSAIDPTVTAFSSPSPGLFGPRLAVCSWSLQPTSPHELAEKILACGLDRVQLALDPIARAEWDATATWNALTNAGVTIVSGMMGTKGEDYSTLESIKATGGVRPSQHWPENLAHARSVARVAHRFGLRLVTFHAGFLPHESKDPESAVLIGRLVEIINVFASYGVRVAFETGQEHAQTLLDVLNQIEKRVPVGSLFGVNFDPANMLLYGMGEPVAALRLLAPWVRQIHIKDAASTTTPGTWGREHPVGKGAVNWPAFFTAVSDLNLRCELVIERESGEHRIADVRSAREVVKQLAPVRPAHVFRMGVIGLGFMGQTHVRSIRSAADAGFPCVLAGVCDRDEARLTGAAPAKGNLKTGQEQATPELLFDPKAVRTFTDPAALLADPYIDAVCICTHTDTHVPLALAALQAGKHVLIEKPVALTATAVEQVAVAAHRAGRVCVPAMCMRFWPGWTFLRSAVRDGRFGTVRSAVFQRLGSLPDWSAHFYANKGLSGGAHSDLHIHDADFVAALFGPPASVRSMGSIDHMSTLYAFCDAGPLHVLAEGGQDHTPGFGFKMRFVVVFERATLDFDLTRETPLLLCTDGKQHAVPLSPLSAYQAQLRHFVELLASGRTDSLATMQDALNVARLLEAEQLSWTANRM